MQYSIVNKSMLHGNLRIDAEFYSPDYLQLEKTLNLHQTEAFSTYSFFVKKGIFDLSPDFYKEQGIPLVRTSEIKDPQIDFSSTVFLDEKTQALNCKTELTPGDLVFTKIGAYIGDVAMLPEKYERYNFSQNVTGVKLKKDKVKSGFLLAYLLSKYGNEQIKRIIMLSGQGKLELEDIKNIKVVLLDENIKSLLHKIVLRAELLKEESVNIYRDAEQILLSELGLLNWEQKHCLSFIKNFSATQTSERIDAEYYQPQYEEIVKAIRKYKDGFDELRNLTSLIGHPSNPPYETKRSENKTFIITQKHLANYFPVDDFWKDDEALYTTDEFMERNKKFILKENDLILYSVGAYIGKANIYNSKIKATIGSFLTLIRADQKAIDPFYLLVFLNSSIGRLLTRRNSRGLAQQYIYPYDTKKVIVPLVKKNIQEKIASLVLKGQHANNTSKLLLEIAKRGVEIAIEKSEAEAEKWIKAEEKKIVEGKN